MGGQPQLPDGVLVVLGLGNPGPRYAATRHNMGFMVVAALAERLNVRLSRASMASLWGEGRLGGRKLLLAQPQTYMNLSGQAGRALLDYFGLGPESLIAVHDDLDLSPGQLKLAARGGSGGHKGVASLLSHLGGDNFLRLKVGIGRPRFGEPVEDFVLSGFYADQRQDMTSAVSRGADFLETAITQGPARAMHLFHTSPKPDKGQAGPTGDEPRGTPGRTE